MQRFDQIGNLVGCGKVTRTIAFTFVTLVRAEPGERELKIFAKFLAGIRHNLTGDLAHGRLLFQKALK